MFNIKQQTILLSLLKLYSVILHPLSQVYSGYGVLQCQGLLIKKKAAQGHSVFYVRLEREHHIFGMLHPPNSKLRTESTSAHWIRDQAECFPQHKDMLASSYSSLSLEKPVCSELKVSQGKTQSPVLLTGILILKVVLPDINSLYY